MDAVFLTWGLEEQTPEQGSELPTTLKSEEELAKFTVDEFLSDTERTVLFLNSGQLIQQRHAISNLPAVVKARGRQGWESVAGPLKSALNKLDADCQVEAAGMFAYIAKERLMPPADLQACLLPTIVRNINREKSEEETEAWLHALFELVPMLDKEALRTEVMSLALSKGDMEDNAASRVICSSILGNISLFMTKDEVERGFFKRALKMCQDVDHTVRLSSCRQLVNIGRTAGRDAVQRNVLDELFELLKDEDLQVRATALTSLVQLLDVISPEVRASRVMPVLRDHMMPFDLDPSMQRSVAKVFGQMVSVVKNEMGPEDAHLFYGCYRHLASKQDVELRRSCAQQIGLLAKAAVSVQPTAYTQHFSETYQSFTSDFDEEVRHAAASQMHDVAKCAGKDSCALVTRPLLNLLRDESARVQAAVLQNLTLTLHAFAADTSTSRQASLDDIARALLDLEANSGRNWRLQASLASSFPSFHQVFTSDQIHEHFIPMTFRMLSQTAAVAAKPVAAEGIACFLRYSKKDKQRAELFLDLIREFARGKCYSQRMAFAEVCKHMVKRFSSRFIKDWVFDLCLELLYDPVPNVRLQITHILPALKQTVRLPEDVDLLERLNNAISNSMTDNDRDVSQTARQINDTYKRMPVRMGGSSGTLVDASGGSQAAYEAEDKRREAEETNCTFTPEDAKEIKAEIVQMSYKKKPGAGADAANKSAINRRVGTDAAKAGTAPPSRPGASAAITSPAKPAGASTASPARPASVSSTASAASRPGAATAAPSAGLGGKLAPGGVAAGAAGRTTPTKPAASSAAGAGLKTTTPTKPVATPAKPVVAASAGGQPLKRK